jgi:hypothetical protein
MFYIACAAIINKLLEVVACMENAMKLQRWKRNIAGMRKGEKRYER